MDAEVIDLSEFRRKLASKDAAEFHQRRSNTQIKAEIDAMVAFGMDDELQSVDLKAVRHSPETK